MLLSGDRAEMCYFAPTALFSLGAINRGELGHGLVAEVLTFLSITTKNIGLNLSPATMPEMLVGIY
jgi:hypothetical protein